MAGLEDYIPPFGKEALDKKLEPYGITFEELKKTGVYPKEGEFKAELKFNTPTGKIELYSTKFEEQGYDPLPHWRDELAPPEPTPEFPFYLTTHRPPMHRHGTTQNVSWLIESYPENRVWINTKTAKELGIKDGDEVYVASKIGNIKLKAYLTQGIRPDTVCVAHGFGHWSKFLSLACGQGENDGDITPAFTLEEMLKRNDPFVASADCDIPVGLYKTSPPKPVEEVLVPEKIPPPGEVARPPEEAPPKEAPPAEEEGC